MNNNTFINHNQPLLTPFQLGLYLLRNRLIMAPLTRRRAGEGNVPVEIMATYYAQRATAGLIIAEASQISLQGIGYMNTPGIHTPEQVEGWKKVTKAVHEKDGLIFLQLWHVGRVSHSLLQPNHQLPVAPSAINPDGELTTPQGKKSIETPRALDLEEIPGIVEDYRKAAQNAKDAGFDGVEIHAANSYLIDQFLHESSNQRKDKYGGPIENRARFLFEVLEAVISVWESEKVGIRLAPSGTRFGMDDPDPAALFTYVIQQLNDFNLAYLHLVEPLLPLDDYPHFVKQVAKYFRPIYKGTLMACGGFTQDTGNQYILEGWADLIAFGKLFIANPDLPKRFELNAPLNQADVDTFYSRSEKGYTDYPFLDSIFANLKYSKLT
ncbi:MAG: alkene reductase [Bacteroidales bacterium]|nr:alkene reductase [Bacteroidales bacterium]